MKTQQTSALKRGFTLMELMVAMAITTIIVTVLVSITSIALETWNRSRSELRASRQAKSMIDTMARDFESLVTRRGNTNEWLSAVVDPDLSSLGNSKLNSENAARLVFFTAATDRYNGEIGNPTKDLGGDVSCVGYRLEYRDPISTGGASNFQSFVLNRLLVDPKETFDKLLGKTDSATAAKSLDKVFNAEYASKLSDATNFICENIYQFTVTFHVQVTTVAAVGTTPATVVNVPVTIGHTADLFRIGGTKITNDFSGNGATAVQVESGRVTAVEISATVLSDFGMEQSKNRTFRNDEDKGKFLSQNSYEYTKLVQLPSM